MSSKKKKPKVIIRWPSVSAITVPFSTYRLGPGCAYGDVSFPLVHLHLESEETLVGAQIRLRIQIIVLLELASPTSGPILLAVLVVQLLSLIGGGASYT